MSLETQKPKFLTLNLNTVFSGVAVLLVIAALSNGWTLNTNMVKVQVTQEQMAATLKELIPRSELEIRFRGYDKEIIELRQRVVQTELEIIKLRDVKH